MREGERLFGGVREGESSQGGQQNQGMVCWVQRQREGVQETEVWCLGNMHCVKRRKETVDEERFSNYC